MIMMNLNGNIMIVMIIISNKVRIFKFLNANVKGDIEYSHTNFIV